uniref:Stabilizer of axonemal microtubules 2 n=1 Tax=Paramormyrops kingsleyae TaxID=1676925 RepID=A0A3B3R0F9_9TELE
MKRSCICNICNCGTSASKICPFSKAEIYSAEKYPSYGPYSPPKSRKPKLEYQENRERMDGTSTFKSDYIPHEVTPQYVRQQVEYRPKSGDIDLRTTYKLDFNRYQVRPFIPVRPLRRSHLNEGRLDTLPTYKEDFRPWEISKRELAKPEFTYRLPSGKFGNATTFQDAFVPRGLVPRESFKPPSIAKLSCVPFDGLTSNRVSYVPHALEARYVRAPEENKPNNQPFQGHTTHQSDFQGLPGQPPESCKPLVTKATSEAPFESRTEFRDSFQQWPVTLPQLSKSVDYESPTKPMDLSTTTKNDFIRHNVQPFIPVKPASHAKRSTAPFQGSTTTRETFRPWMVEIQEKRSKPEEVPKASEKMENLTTSKLHYIQHQIQPNPSFKPKNVPMRTQSPFDDRTMYRTEFTAKKTDMCPASFDSPHGYIFQESDERGHRFYRRLSSQERNDEASAPEIPSTELAAIS